MNWLQLAFIAPILWAAVALLDTYFVHCVYVDAMDGTVISGLFQSTPWLLLPLGLVQFHSPGMAATALALVAGALFLLSFLAYFTALFVANDGALMQLLWNLTVLVVPFVAWLLIGEQLSANHYVGIALAFVGLAAFAIGPGAKPKGAAPIARAMLAAVALLALSMVASKQAYHLATDVVGDDFWSVFLLFCTGASATTLLLLGRRGWRSTALQAQRFGRLGWRYFAVFLMAESLSLIATLASQRAIDLAPAVSLVAVIESLVPVFVMLLSLLLAPLLRHTGRPALAAAYRAQFSNPGRKALAMALIAGGIYVIT